MLTHKTLASYYHDVFVMSQHTRYTLTELEDMVPFEKYLYLDMKIEDIERQKEKNKNAR